MIAEFVPYCRQRLVDDPHLWASTLFDEVVALGFTGSYPSLTAAIRDLGLRPHCEACDRSKGRDTAVIAHPAGAETQWDWLELPDPPSAWGLGKHAHLLVGALAHSSRWRGVLATSEDFPHLVEAMDAVVARLGGLTKVWRFDRMSTVCYPPTGAVLPSFGEVAKHYGVTVVICPPRRGNRKGVVEKANHSAAQRWWRTLPDETTPAQAQALLDRLTARLDTRKRMLDGAPTTVGALADAEPLRPPPGVVFPAELSDERTVTAQGLVSWRGNSYSVPPGLTGARVLLTHRLGTELVRIATPTGAVVAAHTRALDGAGRVVRDDGHVAALEKKVLAGFTDKPPCKHKTRRPPSAAALAEADRLRGHSTPDPASKVVIDFSVYVNAADRLATRAGQKKQGNS
ncbi:Mu transposase domain-containing protein [Fodinicola feengrottensis]|uniref:Mu transposase domain-containing protein n=1 Tax=Fodinicola feengrottensis TaxID=435914 RepID=UPI0013D4832E|nr:DDE-type integrase/transposase/recombinase [Fodinicola feengrottensis]